MTSINRSINALKFVSIFAVILIHSIICVNYTEGTFLTTLSLTRFAVPSFFLISGFYSYYTDKTFANYKYKTRIIRMLKLIIIADIFYLITNLIFHGISSLPTFTIKSIIGLLILNNPLIAGHLWFLWALLYCYLFLVILNKFNLDLEKFFLLIPILLIGNLILGEVSSYLQITIPYYFYRNFIFTGLPFFMIGYLIHSKQESIQQYPNNYLILTLLFSCCLTIFESFYSITDVYVGTILFSVSIFILAILNPNTVNTKITELIGGGLYAFMYILHIFVINTLLKYFSINLGYLNSILVFIVTALISYIVYILLTNLNNHISNINN